MRQQHCLQQMLLVPWPETSWSHWAQQIPFSLGYQTQAAMLERSAQPVPMSVHLGLQTVARQRLRLVEQSSGAAAKAGLHRDPNRNYLPIWSRSQVAVEPPKQVLPIPPKPCLPARVRVTRPQGVPPATAKNQSWVQNPPSALDLPKSCPRPSHSHRRCPLSTKTMLLLRSSTKKAASGTTTTIRQTPHHSPQVSGTREGNFP
mmetsp:Transcript_49465/g.108029  ORF Transcript_49465/g.108029 Transcript_49465/m.108029 type:complete len:203 (+) Transcript_49465:258-866(+)